MTTKIIDKSFIINNVPLDEMRITSNSLIINFDDINEKRCEIIFKPYQALKVTTADCFDKDILLINGNLETGRYQQHILEVENSEWIEELKNILLETDPNANFLEKARHFILDMGDNIIEIIATNIKIM